MVKFMSAHVGGARGCICTPLDFAFAVHDCFINFIILLLFIINYISNRMESSYCIALKNILHAPMVKFQIRVISIIVFNVFVPFVVIMSSYIIYHERIYVALIFENK